MTSYGWAPVGQRILKEYGDETTPTDSAPTMRFAKTWGEIKGMQSMKSLLALAVDHMRLLHAVDTFPRGGLCQGSNLKESLRRYEKLWLPLIASLQSAAPNGYSQLVPPLDIAFLWHLHRLQPEAYAADCAELITRDGRRVTGPLHVQQQQAFVFTDGQDPAGASTAAVWQKYYPQEPFYPPPPPGSQTASFRSHLSADLAAVAVRMPVFLHQLLRACYCQRPFLDRAVDRYAKFLLLKKHHLELQHPIPPVDITLMWVTHMSCSGDYAADCNQLLARLFLDLPGAGASPWLERDISGPWRFHFKDTQRAWEDEFDEPFVVPGSGYVPLDSPHPAETLVNPQLLAYYEQQPAAAATGAAAAAAAQKVSQSSWRAGAHALYLLFLKNPNLLIKIQQRLREEELARNPAAAAAAAAAEAAAAAAAQQAMQQPAPVRQQQKRKSNGGLFACFGCGGADADDDIHISNGRPSAAAAAAVVQQQQQVFAHQKPVTLPLLSDGELKKLVAGFSSFRNLPHSSSHPYWQQLTPRSDVSPLAVQQEGAEVEVYAAAAAAAAAAANGSSNGRDVGLSDQDVVTGDYEVQVAGGLPLLW